MGIEDWLRQVGSTVSKGVSWLGNNVVAPVSNFLKQVPIVGDVVRAAEPLGNFIQKTADYGSNLQKPANQRGPAPTMQDFGDAVKSGFSAYGAARGVAPQVQKVASAVRKYPIGFAKAGARAYSRAL